MNNREIQFGQHVDIISLVAKNPNLLGALKQVGLSIGQVVSICIELTSQLRNGRVFDLTPLLAELSVQEYMGRVDSLVVAEKTYVDVMRVRSAVQLIGSAIQSFDGRGESFTMNEQCRMSSAS